MNKNEYENNMIRELSPEEEANIDRLLRDTAAFDDSKVDYDRILSGIRRKAKAEGIAIFPAAKKSDKKKNGRIVRGILSGFGAAAAVFVVGIATFTLLTGLGKQSLAPSAYDNQKSTREEQTESAATFAPITPDHHSASDVEIVTQAPVEPASRTEVPEPTLLQTFAPIDPVIISQRPTESPAACDDVTYIEIAVPDGSPASAGDLIPAALPEGMTVEESETELEVAARSEDGLYYSCRALLETPADLDTGELRCSESDGAKLEYLWRIGESSCLEFEFIGFTREEAETLIRQHLLRARRDAPHRGRGGVPSARRGEGRPQLGQGPRVRRTPPGEGGSARRRGGLQRPC